MTATVKAQALRFVRIFVLTLLPVLVAFDGKYTVTAVVAAIVAAVEVAFRVVFPVEPVPSPLVEKLNDRGAVAVPSVLWVFLAVLAALFIWFAFLADHVN